MNRDVFNGISNTKDRVTVIDTMYSASELKGVIKACDFVLGERAHALISAVSVATPCVALTTEEDFRMPAVLRDMFDRVTYNLNSPQTIQLMALLTEEWDKRAQSRMVMMHKSAEIHLQAADAARLLQSRIANARAKQRQGLNVCWK